MALALLASCVVSAQTDMAISLTGNWQFVASPFEGGEENISFTATLSEGGNHLQCHADNFFAHGSKPYPADWLMAVERDGDKLRLGWILDSENPCSTEEYQEPASAYALFGRDADGAHRYIYFLSENIETQRLEGMTLWSDWQSQTDATFTLPKTYQLYAVVSENQPYNGAVGYIDIWASPRVRRTSGTAVSASTFCNSSPASSQTVYNMMGQRVGHPTKGLYIKNGKKYLQR